MTFNEAIEGVVKIVGIITPIVLAWIGYKQVVMNKKQDAIDKKVDGHMSRLMAMADEGNFNKGILQEKGHSESTTAALNEKLVEASKQITPETKPVIAEVKVVNEQPIEVKNIPPDQKT